MKTKKFCAILLLLSLALTACAPAPVAPDVSPPPAATSLAPYSSGEVGVQYYGEPRNYFTPSDEYGAVYPYIGGFVNAQSWYGAAHTYGFATADGRIICEPVFTSIGVFEYGGEIAYTATRGVPNEPFFGADHYISSEDVTYESYFIADGGAVCIETDGWYYNSTARELGDGYFSYAHDGKWYVTDIRGNQILPQTYNYIPAYGDGLFVVTDGIFTHGYDYVNPDGESVLHVDVSESDFNGWIIFSDDGDALTYFMFSEGLAVKTQNGHVGYIDITGAYIIEPQYQWAVAFDGGVAVVSLPYPSNTSLLIDTAGREILRAESIGAHGSGLFSVYDGSSRHLYVDREGNTVYEGYGYISVYDSYIIRDNDEMTRSEVWRDGEMLFSYDAEPDKTAYTYYLADGLFELHVQPRDNNAESGRATYVMDDCGNVLWEYPDYAFLYQAGDVFVVNSGGMRGLLSRDFELILPMNCEELTAYGDYYALRIGRFGGIMDKDGNWVVKRSLTDYLDD